MRCIFFYISTMIVALSAYFATYIFYIRCTFIHSLRSSSTVPFMSDDSFYIFNFSKHIHKSKLYAKFSPLLIHPIFSFTYVL